MCNFLEYKDTKIVYRRYASLFFIAGCSSDDNELITLEIIHRYVEQMDKYYGNVCELDIIFSFTKAYYILDEILLAGELQESSKKNVLRCIGQQDSLEDMEVRCPFGLFATVLWRFGLSLRLSNTPSFSLLILRPLTYLFLCSGRGRGYEDNVTRQCILSSGFLQIC
ncbi:clathrin adaptor complex small chain-domain-containing protein, partial [Hypoxylon cercidicola]